MADFGNLLVEKGNDQPLFIQLRQGIRKMLETGELVSGEKLPPVADLARILGVTPSTVRRAFRDLTADGLLESHVGRGTFALGPESRSSSLSSGTEEGSRPSLEGFRNLSELLLLSKRPGVISFTRGLPAPQTVPDDLMRRMTGIALRHGEEPYRDSGDPAGIPGLRERIARLYQLRGVAVAPEQVLVTGGSQQGITLMAQYAASRQVRVFTEVPLYMGVVNAFNAFGVRTEPVARGEIPPSVSVGTSPLFYFCPAVHNPRGDDLNPAVCQDAAQWARSTGGILLVDEVFNDLRYEGTEPHNFLLSPGTENTVLAGSLSKSVTSGLRVGWLIASEERIRTLARMKKAMDIACPPLIQGVAEAILTGDFYPEHLRKVCAYYRKRRDATLSALEKLMPREVCWSTPTGGFQLWVTLPEGVSSVALYLESVSAGVAFIPGPLQHPDQGLLSNFRICYGDLSPEEIETGIGRLARVTERLIHSGGSAIGLAGVGDFF